VNSANSALSSVNTMVAAIDLASTTTDLRDMQRTLVDSLNTDQIADAFYPVLFESGPTRSSLEASATYLTLPILLCILCSLCGVGCLVGSKRKPRPKDGTRRCGVQTVGFCWVLSALLAVIYLVLSGGLIGAGTGAKDMTVVMRALPQDPERVIGSAACADPSLRFGTSGTSFCAASATCTAGGPNATLAHVVLQSLNQADLMSRLDSNLDRLRTDLNKTTAVIADLPNNLNALSSATSSLAPLSSATFNAPPSTPAATTIDDHLGYIRGNISDASTTLNPLLAPAANLTILGNSLINRLVLTRAGLQQLIDVTRCDYLHTLWDDVLAPFSQVWQEGVISMGTATCALAVMTFLLIGPAIWMQIRFGGVGAESDIGENTDVGGENVPYGSPVTGYPAQPVPSSAPVMATPYGAAAGYPKGIDQNEKL